MTGVLMRGGRVRSADGRWCDAIAAEQGVITWLGDAADAPAGLAVRDLDGAVVLPAFADAHVHTTMTGLALGGLDLTGCGTREEAMKRLAGYAATHPAGVLLGTGWDESRWPDRAPLTSADVDRAAPGRVVYLSRTDAHSGAISTALLSAEPGIAHETGFDASGLLALDSHERARKFAYASVDPVQRRDAQRRTRATAAALGIGCLHENAGPVISGTDDLADLAAIARDEPGPEVVTYWGGLDVEQARELGCAGAAGDLFLDGSIGSHTAALSRPYTDRQITRGILRHEAEDVTEHVIACTEAGLQAGFHVIGDLALATALTGFEMAAVTIGAERVRAARHRLEHVELADEWLAARIARLGIVASVQPAFDAAWGGPDGMYARRLGTWRARGMNPFAMLESAGVALAFGSDAPVTPLDPWGGVVAAVRHRTPEHRLAGTAAFAAHTLGSWRAGRIDDSGALAPGMAATFALWDDPDGLVDTLLADEDPTGRAYPSCRATVVRGTVVHSST
ncbi:MAG: amidohydrolase family protein [Streptosporangiales bacterium]|nr:amidohydrolase family protein [Streptosporangiales bacterium]